MRHLLALSVLFFVFFTTAFAADRYALVIGNDDYQELPPLKKAANDATAVGDAVESLGFTVIRGRNQTLRQMQDSLFDLTGRLNPGDTVFIFYAGHGVAIGGGNYLLPVDTPLPKGAQAEGRIRFASLGEADIIQQVKTAGAQLTIVVLDACRDNPFAAVGTRSIGETRGLAAVRDERGVFGIYSAGFGQTALDRLGDDDADPNSVFTRVLVPALREPGLSLVDVAYRVNERVEQLARSVQHDQSPAYYDQARGQRVYLAGLPKEPVSNSPDQASGKASASSVIDPYRDAGAQWAEIRSLNDKTLFEDHITRFGTCAFAPLAKIALAKIDNAAFSSEPGECDRMAANTDDPDRLDEVKGVKFENIEPGAVKACEAALAEFPHERRLAYQLGRSYDASKRYSDALRVYQQAAEAGSALAMMNLARLHREGSGVPKSQAQAVSYWRKAAEAAQPLAMIELGQSYATGEGIKRDYKESMRWFMKAYELRDIDSYQNIGWLYANGYGVRKNLDEAARWYEKGKNAGDGRSIINLAALYDTGESSLPVSADKAAELLEEALRLGHEFSRGVMRSQSADWTLASRKALQVRLKNANVYDGPIDGSFGRATQTAIDRIFNRPE